MGTSDLTTPFTDAASAVGNVLMQKGSRGRPWQPDASSSPEDSNSYLTWQLLYYSHGNRELLSASHGQGSPSGAWVLLIFSLVLLAVCCCVCSINVVPELPKLPATLPGPSMRPSLEPRDHLRSQTRTPVPPTEDSSPARIYSTKQICCPDLLVPRGSQSVLGVPYLASASAETSPVVFVDVVDPIGMPILKAELNLASEAARQSHSARLKPAPEPLIVLRNLRPEARGSLLRSPKRGFVDTSALALVQKSGSHMEICLPDNSIFACLQKEEDATCQRFALKIGAEEIVSMIFRGATVDALSVTDSQKRSLAKTQSGGLSFEATERKFYSIQVHSGVDVGVLLCCLLYIDGLSQRLF